MQIISGARQTGRTTKLVKYAFEKGATIVCPSYQHIQNVLSIAKELSLQIKLPTDMRSFVKNFSVDDKNVYVMDDAELCMEFLKVGTMVMLDTMRDEHAVLREVIAELKEKASSHAHSTLPVQHVFKDTKPDQYVEKQFECCGLCKSALGTADNLLCSAKIQPFTEYPKVKFYGICPRFMYRQQ